MSTIASVSSSASDVSSLYASNTTLRTGASATLGAPLSSTGSSTGTVQGADQSSISRLGQLMNSLQQMASTDQDAFKNTVRTIADNLTQSANESPGAAQKQAFATAAAMFAEAANTGSMDSLQDLRSGASFLEASRSTATGADADTVTISDAGKELASQQEGGSQQQGSGGQAAANTASGQAGAGGSGSADSSSTTDTTQELEEQIEELKQEIKALEEKLQQAKQAAEADPAKAAEAKTMTTQLSSLNAELATLETQKLEAESQQA